MRLFIIFALLTSCTHKFSSQELEQRITNSEIRNVREVRTDLGEILDAHPELTDDVKARLRMALEQYLTTHEALKREEARLVHVILQEGLGPDGGDQQTQRLARIELSKVYQRKQEVLGGLLDEIKSSTRHLKHKDTLYRETELLLREVR